MPAGMITSKPVAMLVLMVGSMSASTQSVEGVWRSEGWGSLYEIDRTTSRSFEITSTTCVAGFSAKRISGGNAGNGISFRSHNGGLFYIVSGGGEEHKRLEHPGGLTSVTLTRISALPDVCRPPTLNTPLGNFDVFARTFAENYIAFDLRHVNWDQIAAQQRAKITAQTTPTRLFEILRAMIEPLADIHTGIEAPRIRCIFDPALRPGTDRVVRGTIRSVRKGRKTRTGEHNQSQVLSRSAVLSL